MVNCFHIEGERVVDVEKIVKGVVAVYYQCRCGQGRIIEQGLKEQGIRKPLVNGTKHHEFKSAHGFRKYFKTKAEQSGMKAVNVETLLGHDTGLSMNYYRPTEYDLLQDYLKAVDNLTIDDTPRMRDVTRNQEALAAQLEQSRTQMESKDKEVEELRELCKHSLDLSSKQNSMIHDVMSKYDKLIDEYNNLKGLLDKSMSTTKTVFGRIEELERVMRGGLLIKPGRRTAEELQRRVKILLQVAPDWKERTASGNS